MECHHQGLVAVAHIDKWDHAKRTDPEFWKFGTLERMRERPPKKAATKEQVEHPPWSQKIQGGSCSQIRLIFRHQGLARHSQCQLTWSCNMKRWIRIGSMPVPVYQTQINMRRAEMPQWLHPWEHEGNDMESRQILQAYREVINTCVHRYQYIEILLQCLLALARLSRIKHLHGLFFRNSQWYMNTFIYSIYVYICIYTYIRTVQYIHSYEMNKFGMLSIRIPKTLSEHSEINSLGWLHEILRQSRMYKYSPLKATVSLKIHGSKRYFSYWNSPFLKGHVFFLCVCVWGGGSISSWIYWKLMSPYSRPPWTQGLYNHVQVTCLHEFIPFTSPLPQKNKTTPKPGLGFEVKLVFIPWINFWIFDVSIFGELSRPFIC